MQNIVFKNKKVFILLLFSFCAQEVSAQAPLPSPYNPASPVNFIRTWDAKAPIQNGNLMLAKGIKDVAQNTIYYDGLGRPLQSVAKQASMETLGNPIDLVSPVLYDDFGREQFKYLPFAATNNDGAFKLNPFQQQQSFMQQQFGTQNETFYYSKTNYEASPLNRVTESYAPGNSWAGSEANPNTALRRNIQMAYWINTNTDEVRIWDVQNVSLTNFGNYFSSLTYPAGELYKNVTVDEHKKQVIEFKDKEGKIILKKVQLTASADDGNGKNHNGWLCTYYIYDDFNNLRCVIQPEAVKRMSENNNWDIAPFLNEQCFRYQYDSRNRMIMKKVPGAGEVYMVYDARDRLVLTQDANMRVSGQWLITKYDAINRPVETGLLSNNQPFETHLQSAAGSTSYIPSGSYDMLTLTHYDDYAGLPSGLSPYLSTWNSYFSNTDNQNWPYPQMPVQSNATKGLVTWTQIKVLGTPSTYLSTVNYYDDKSRIIQVQSRNLSGGTDVLTTQYTWAGQPLIIVQQQQKSGNNPQTTVIITKNTYDDLGRIAKIEKKLSNTLINGGAMPGSFKTIVENEYDKMGQLKKKKIGDNPSLPGNPLETLTYDYNIRGWMLGANRDFTRDANNTHFFGFELGYDKTTLTESTLTNGGGSGSYQYNGNIDGMVWKSKGDAEKRKYDFEYDAANRILKADFSQFTSGSFNQSTGINFNMQMGDGNNPYSAYDANGNILQMQQWGFRLASSTQIDYNRYTYESSSNKLKMVVDFNNDPQTKMGDFRTALTHNQYAAKSALTPTSPAPAFEAITDYQYDANGNLITDHNKDIASITYNHLSLPLQITINGKGTITYTYDAAGNKLRKTTVDNTANPTKTTTTDYMGGLVYENDLLQFAAHEEGRVRFIASGSGSPAWAYDYMLKDHLGNIRSLITEEQKTDAYPVASLEAATIATESNYYDALNDGRVTTASVNGYPYDGYTNPNDYTQKLRGDGVKLGANMVLKVMAGDQFNVRVSSWYKLNGNTPAASQNPLNDLLAAMAGSIGNITSTHGGATTQEITNSGVLVNPVNSFLQNQPSAVGKPKAYLNWILLDEQLKFSAGNSLIVGTDNILTPLTQSDIPINKNGYLYIYVSNETPNIDVFFDNLQVTHIRGPLVEETHYYPFGLVMQGISSKALGFGEPSNKRKFNGGNELQSKEFNDGTGLEIFDAVNRIYDPQIGRFWQIDELAEANWEVSPFAFAINNPISFNDPLGLDPEPAENGGKVKELENVTIISIPKGLYPKQNLYYDIMHLLNQNGATIDNIAQPSLREMMYRFDDITNLRSRNAEKARASDKVFLEAASFFIPISWLTKIKYAKYVLRLFQVKRGLTGFKVLKYAAQFGIKTARELKKVSPLGSEVHHLIEQRFAKLFGQKADDMASIVVTQDEHKIFTKAWSDRIGRNGWKTTEFTTSTVPNQQYVLDVAKDIYKDYPEILKALGL